MQQDNKHFIGTVKMDLDLASIKHASSIQDNLSHTFWSSWVQKMEQMLEELLGPDKWLVVDQIEIDLGILSMEELCSAKGLAMFLKQLKSSIIKELAIAPVDLKVEERAVSVFERWLFFLEGGSLPWHVHFPRQVEHWQQAIFETLATHEWAVLKLRQLVSTSEHAFNRLLLQHDVDFYQKIVELYTGKPQIDLVAATEKLAAELDVQIRNYWQQIQHLLNVLQKGLPSKYSELEAVQETTTSKSNLFLQEEKIKTAFDELILSKIKGSKTSFAQQLIEQNSSLETVFSRWWQAQRAVMTQYEAYTAAHLSQKEIWGIVLSVTVKDRQKLDTPELIDKLKQALPQNDLVGKVAKAYRLNELLLHYLSSLSHDKSPAGTNATNSKEDDQGILKKMQTKSSGQDSNNPIEFKDLKNTPVDTEEEKPSDAPNRNEDQQQTTVDHLEDIIPSVKQGKSPDAPDQIETSPEEEAQEPPSSSLLLTENPLTIEHPLIDDGLTMQTHGKKRVDSDLSEKEEGEQIAQEKDSINSINHHPSARVETSSPDQSNRSNLPIEIQKEATNKLDPDEKLEAFIQQLLVDEASEESLPNHLKQLKALQFSHPEANMGTLSQGSTFFIPNAGVVILHAFMAHLFKKLEWVIGKEFTTAWTQQKAVHLIHFLATGDLKTPEYNLVLPKFLCSIPLNVPIHHQVNLEKAEVEEAERMMQAAIAHWEAIGSVSIEGLREGFLQRDGKLEKRQTGWTLMIERKTLDILLDRLPWTISMVKLPWMQEMLRIEWAK